MTTKKALTVGSMALDKASVERIEETRRRFPLQPPELMPGVVPKGKKAPVMAMDNPCYNYAGLGFGFGGGFGEYNGFPGYPYLAQLTTEAEYRSLASSYSTEITRAGIKIVSSRADDESVKEKISLLTERTQDMKLMNSVQEIAAHNELYGAGYLFIDIDGHKRDLPLVVSNRTIKQGSFRGVRPVEPMWITPNGYNSIDPAAPDFYKPHSYFMLGQQVHASRLSKVITRPMPDILKPAFNFGGISTSQIAEPYVHHFRRTRKDVSNIIDKFSIVNLATDLSTIAQDNGANVINRAKLFQMYRSNLGVMLTNKETEELNMVNTPLSELQKLLDQALSLMCVPSKMPGIILTGIEPTGLNASSEGSLKAWGNWIAANQEAFYRHIIDLILKILQLDMFGELDTHIGFTFNPLEEMSDKELAEIRKGDADSASQYVAMGALAPVEVREKLARDPESGYHGIDTDLEVVPPNQDDEGEDNEDSSESDDDPEPFGKKKVTTDPPAMDAEFSESDHPRDEDGKFSSEGVASKLGYKVVRHDSESSYATTPGYRKGTSGYTDASRKEIHLSTEGRSQAYVNHYLHHEVGHTVDYSQRNADGLNTDKVANHKHASELKKIATAFKNEYNFKSPSTLRYYQNSVNEVMAEAFAMYQEKPQYLKQIAPKVYEELDNHLKGL